MNKTVYDVDFTRALPDPLKNDPNMLALGKVIAEELRENIKLARITIIYPLIDELPEVLLDILARDLNVGWYDDSYPIAAKRQIIKDSVRVQRWLGTKYAVVTAIGSIFPHTEVQEWFEYGGEPYQFRIILDMTNAKAPADFFQIVRAAEFYKRLTSHLDEIIYQTSVNIVISTETEVFGHTPLRTGTYRAGTRPRRNIRGGIANPQVEIQATGEDYKFNAPRTGTKPRRNTGFVIIDNDVYAETKAEAFLYTANMTGRDKAGTQPHRDTSGQAASGGIIPAVMVEAFSFNVRRCGQHKTKG